RAGRWGPVRTCRARPAARAGGRGYRRVGYPGAGGVAGRRGRAAAGRLGVPDPEGLRRKGNRAAPARSGGDGCARRCPRGERPLRGCRGTGCAVPLDGCTGQPCRAGARRGDPGRRGNLRVRAAVRVGRPGLATAAASVPRAAVPRAAVPRAAVPRPGGAWRRGERGARPGRTTAHLCGAVAAVGGGPLPVPRVARTVRTGTAAAAALATTAGRR